MIIYRWIAERIAAHGEGKSWLIIAPHRLCPIIGEDILCLVWEAMIASLTIGYAFDVGELLARELRDRAIVEQKALLAYLCMIT